MRTIIGWCLGNRPLVLLLGLVILGGGFASILQLNQELLPSLELPVAVVVVQDPGAGPEQVDADVTQPLVSGLSGLPRARGIRSSSRDGLAQLIITFDVDSAVRDDLAAVNQRLPQISLPPGASRPLVLSYDSSLGPSMAYSLIPSDGDLARATREANDVVAPALAGASGLAQVKVLGGTQQTIAVIVDPALLAAAGITIADVDQALGNAVVDVPAGVSVSTGRQLPVQVSAHATTADDLRHLTVGHRGGDPRGKPVALSEVATVTPADQPVGGMTRINGAPALQIQVIRAQDGNALALSDDVRSRVSRLDLDRRDSLELVNDDAIYLRSSLNDLIAEGLIGAALAVVVIFAFLRSVRGTLVTAVSLPASVLVALIGTRVAGFSLNVLTLAGLTIAVGRIVDDAIVVLENSYRHIQLGEHPREAALSGASEVVLPIVSSTLTTVAVFLPIGFIGGLISKLFLPFSLTVTIALLASLVVAVTLVPVLVSFLIGRLATDRHREPVLARVYRPMMRWSLRRWPRKLVVVAASLAMLGSALFAATRLPLNLLDFGGSDRLVGTVTLPVGTSMADTERQLHPFEDRARLDPDVRQVEVDISDGSGRSLDATNPPNQASITVVATSKRAAPGLASRLQADLQRRYGTTNAQLSVYGGSGTAGNGFSVTLQGHDPAALSVAADRVVAELQKDDELSNVKSGLAPVKPQVAVDVDPARAGAHGLGAGAAAQLLSGYLSPRTVGKLGPNGPLVVLSAQGESTSGPRLTSLPLAPGTRLGDIATVRERQGAAEIDRENGVQQATVTATVTAQDTQRATSRAQQRAQGVRLPAGVTFGTVGSVVDIGANFTSMFEAIGIAIASVFLVLVAFFRSVITPFVILLTMPLALIGSLFALLAFRQPLGLPALLGVLMVFGIVVSNAILLIDFTERDRGQGRPLMEALLRAGAVRLRPILMTALATVFALLPVATGFGAGGGGGLISQPLAVVVEGGMVSSTLLTLLVVPVVYSLMRASWSVSRAPAAPAASALALEKVPAPQPVQTSNGETPVAPRVQPSRLDPSRLDALLDIAWELLAGAIRDSGADSIQLSIRLRPDGVEVRLADNGSDTAGGAPATGRAQELRTFAEEVARLGGRADLRTYGREGTVMVVTLPGSGG